VMKVFLKESLDAYLHKHGELPEEQQKAVRNDAASRRSDFALLRLA